MRGLSFILLLLLLAGCYIPSEPVNRLEPTLQGMMTISFTPNEINDMIITIVAAQPTPFFRGATVTLQPGQVILSGERNGFRGSVTLILFAADERLQVMATGLEEIDLTLQDESIIDLTEALQIGLTTVLNREGELLRVESVLVLADQVDFRIVTQTSTP